MTTAASEFLDNEAGTVPGPVKMGSSAFAEGKMAGGLLSGRPDDYGTIVEGYRP
jgi:hypothetical protein